MLFGHSKTDHDVGVVGRWSLESRRLQTRRLLGLDDGFVEQQHVALGADVAVDREDLTCY
jgi:hypothetical protein